MELVKHYVDIEPKHTKTHLVNPPLRMTDKIRVQLQFNYAMAHFHSIYANKTIKMNASFADDSRKSIDVTMPEGVSQVDVEEWTVKWS